MNSIKLGKYKHFKGDLIEVIAVGKHSETLEDMVVYKKLHATKDFPEGQVWVRPLSMFLEIITREGKTFKRFELVE
ncbi:DUF1653 domain-containing protein [Candidatus Woesearchaeota archaeon]|nr:DUF1653 domain-containing protein [Candidatus Woesearchaeota archaeon]